MTDHELEERARRAYYARPLTRAPWESLSEAQRESWRCEVDPARRVERRSEWERAGRKALAAARREVYADTVTEPPRFRPWRRLECWFRGGCDPHYGRCVHCGRVKRVV